MNIYRKQIFSNNRGVLLIEGLIAMAIFAIGILAVASLLINANRSLRSSSEVTLATALAENKLEQILGVRYTTLLANPYLMGGVGYQEYDDKLDPNHLFKIEWLVTVDPPAFGAGGTGNVALIEVTTSWKSSSQIVKNRQITVDFVKTNVQTF